MEIKAWMQLGVERRETVIEISDEEMEGFERWAGEDPGRCFETWVWNYVQDWLFVQFGFGWQGGSYQEDLSRNEGNPDGVLSVTSESSIPNTVRIRLDCPICRARRS